MSNEISWEYYIDYNISATTGVFALFRNPIYLGADGLRRYRYSTYPQSPESTEIPLTMTRPIAKGIAAFFAGGYGPNINLYRSLKNKEYFDSVYLYKVYLRNVSKWVFLENTQSPNPKPVAEVDFAFLTQHLIDEKTHLTDSENYFLECFDENDLKTKAQIKEYLNGYIVWIEEKINPLKEVEQNKDAAIVNEKFGIASSPLIKAPILVSELSPIEYITAIEQILYFIFECFRDQSYPNHRPFLTSLSELLTSEKMEFRYLLHIDSDLLNFTYFKTLIRSLLVDSNTKFEGLKVVLKNCFEISKLNSNLYSKYLEIKSIEDYDAIYIEFGSTSGDIMFDCEPQQNKHYDTYYNFDFGALSKRIYTYLEMEVFYDVLEPNHSSGLKSDSNLSNFDQSTIFTSSHPSSVINPSLLDQYKPFEYIQVIENLLIFIKQKFEYQDKILWLSEQGTNPDSKREEFEYELEINSDLIDSLYFKRRCKEIYASNEFNREALKDVLNSTYFLAKTTFIFYNEKLLDKKFDCKNTISLRYDQINGVITNVLMSSDVTLHTNHSLSMFCNNIVANIQNIFYQGETVPLKGMLSGNESEVKDIPPILNDLSSKPISDKITMKPKKETLFNIWEMSKEHYDEIIRKLATNVHLPLDIPFVTCKDNLHYWNKSIKSSKSYLSGFIYTCLLKKWILDKHDSKEYKLIIKNTFNIDVDTTPYKGAHGKAKSHDNKYLEPFKAY